MNSNNIPLVPKNRTIIVKRKIFDKNNIQNGKAWNPSKQIFNNKLSKNDKSTNINPYELKITLQPLLDTQNRNQTTIETNYGKPTSLTLNEDLEKQISLLQHVQQQQQQPNEPNAVKPNDITKNILKNNVIKDFETIANNANGLKCNQLNEGCNRNMPWVALVISFIQIIMFSFSTENVYQFLLYTPYRRYQIWRFWTYTLLHSDQIHLMINIALQFLTSFFLEIEQGYLKVLFIYTMGGIAGSLGTSIFQPKLLMVGSSAGVYSLLMSHVPHLIMNFRILPYRYLRIIAVMILCASDIGFSIYHCLIHSNQSPQISLAAHLSGASAGFLLAFIIYSKTEYKFFKIFQYLSMSIFCSFLIFAIFFNFNCKPLSQNRFKCFL